jgi:hypothetical protein
MSSDVVIRFSEKPGHLFPPDFDTKEQPSAPAENVDLDKVILSRLQPLARQYADLMVLPNSRQKTIRLANQISGVICQLKREFPYEQAISLLQETWNNFSSLKESDPRHKSARRQFLQPFLLPAQDRFFHIPALKNHLFSFLSESDRSAWGRTCKANYQPTHEERHEMSLTLAWSEVIFKAISETGVQPSIGRNATADEIRTWLKANQPTLDLVKSLNFTYAFSGPLPPELKKFRNLQELKLVGCHLKSLPEWIGDFRYLEDLSLQENHLTSIPASIGKLKNLTFLSLSHNKICEIPTEIGNLTKLNHLSFNHNQIKKIPRSIGSLTHLKVLYASGNEITEVPREIGRLRKMEELYLSHNKLERLPRSLSDLVNTLHYLGLHKNPLTSHDKEILSGVDTYTKLAHIKETGHE